MLAIDDLADRDHDSDLLVDQNVLSGKEAKYDGRVPGHCRLLCGPRYAMLREEFRGLHATAKPRSGTVRKLLVMFGGVDAANLTGEMLRILGESSAWAGQADVVIGAQHSFRKDIECFCRQNGFACHVQTKHVAGLMAEADLAVGAG